MPQVHHQVTQDMHLSKICIDPIGPKEIQNGMSVSIPCETEISVTCPAGKVCFHKESITFYETQRLIFGQTNEGKIILLRWHLNITKSDIRVALCNSLKSYGPNHAK